MKQALSAVLALVLLMTSAFSAVGVQAASDTMTGANTGDISNAKVFIVVAVVALVLIVLSIAASIVAAIVLSIKGKKK